MSPQWFALDGIPYAEMWDDARSWLPIRSFGPGHPRRLLVQRRSCHRGRDVTHNRSRGSVKTTNLSAYTQDTQANVAHTYLMPV